MATLNKIYILLLLTSLAALVQNSEAFGSYRSQVETVYPTINCIIDYSVYESHNFNEQKIAREFSYIWTNVKALYKKIPAPKIELVYRGCKILKNKKESTFVKASLIGIISPELTLKTFGQYLSGQRTPVDKQANINVLFTNYKMCMGNYCKQTSTVGLANVASACLDASNAVGVIKVQEPHNTVHTVAHELAHMLGAHHDGDRRTNNCNSKDFIMTPTHGIETNPITTPNPLDVYKWSSCTVDMIHNYITNGEGQCLLKRSNEKNSDDDIYKTKVDERKPKNPLNKPTSPPPKKNNVNVNVQTRIENQFSLDGALSIIDDECKNKKTLGICADAYKDKNICKPVVCVYQRSFFGIRCRTVVSPVSQNLPCGDNKVCSDGHCVVPNDVEVPNESPDYGDNNDDFHDDNNDDDNDDNNDDNDESFNGDNNSENEENTYDIGAFFPE